jgi:hypothetical protein
MSKNEVSNNKIEKKIGGHLFNSLAEALAAVKPGETIRMQGVMYVIEGDTPSRFVNCKVYNNTGQGILLGKKGGHSVFENGVVSHHEDESSKD